MTNSGGGGGSSTKSRPRYAPEDPTLPKPWKPLVDDATGYVYYWNTETNVTQYERPSLPLPPPPPPHLAPRSAVYHSRNDRDRDRDRDRVDDRDRDRRRDDWGRDDGRRDDNRRDDKRDARTSQQIGSERGGSGHSLKDLRDARTTSSRSHGGLLDAAGATSVEAYRRQNEIIVSGDNVPAPYTTFESAGFPQEILKEVHHAGFSYPTPIQAQSWPIAMQGRDVVAIAKTGSGKTLGYLIPGFIQLKHLQNNPKMGPTVLILAPTRELATQIQVEAVKFGRSSRISCTCLYGGAPKGPQLRDLDRGVDVVVATPGRLNDILEMRRISLQQVSFLVLDEADRMLDMGFEPQIRKIVEDIPHRRQTLMFTATWPKEVRKIAADLLVRSVQVNIGRTDELVANNAITQHIEVITPMEKFRRVEQILRSQDPGSKVIIFCSTKRMCDNLSHLLTRQFNAAAIHGDKSQTERDRVLGQFRSGRSPILVATDVAARGLDIKDIRVVINYDFPTGVEDYVHRIGRTGRAGATGISYTFFCEQDSKYAADLVKILEGANQRVPKELRDMISHSRFGGKSRRWGSVTESRNSGRPYAARVDSFLSSRGGRDLPPSSGRPDSRNGNYDLNANESSRDRYDRGHEDSRKVGVPENISRGRGRSRSRSRSRSHSQSRKHSPSPKRGRVERMRSQSPSRNRASPKRGQVEPIQSRSPSRNQASPKRGRGEQMQSRSPCRNRSPKRGRAEKMQSQSPSRNRDHRSRSHDRNRAFEPYRHRRSKSRSPSPSRGYDNYTGASKQTENQTSPLSPKVHSPSDHGIAYPNNSLMPCSSELRKVASDDFNEVNAHLDQSSNPHYLVSRSPSSLKDSGRQQQWGERSPSTNGNSKESAEYNIQSPILHNRVDDEEEEEGMIPADEEDGIIQEEGRSPDITTANPATEK